MQVQVAFLICILIGNLELYYITRISDTFSDKHLDNHFMQEDELEKRKSELIGSARIEAEVKELRKENAELKQYILALQGEVYGARLAAKYLDKELAGRQVEWLCLT